MTPPMNPTYTREGRARLRARIVGNSDVHQLRKTVLEILDMTEPDLADDVAHDRITPEDAAALHDGWTSAHGEAWRIAQENFGVSGPTFAAQHRGQS